MRKNYLLGLFLTLLWSISSLHTQAQTTLSPGDIVIIDFNTDNDTFKFMPLVDLEVGTTIKFTDEGWLDGTGGTTKGFRGTSEDTGTYTVSGSTVTRGTIISYDSSAPPATFSGEVLNAFSVSGDQLLVYQGTEASPTFIFAIQTNSTEWQTGADANDSNRSALPEGLTNDVNAIAVGAGGGLETEYDNAYYSGATSGTYGAIAALIGHSDNWTGDNGTSYTPASSFTFTTPITWSGTTDTHWEDPTNWSGGVPTKLDDVSIPSVGTLPEIHDETAGQVRNLTIATGATLTVNGNNSILINGDLTADGTLLIKSNPTTNGSMILAGNYGGTGTVSYERELEGSEWHLISSPVSGQSISAFSGVVATNSVRYAIAPYDNSKASGSRWDYYTTGAGSNNIASAGSFTVARGYSIQKSTAGTITLSGTPPTADIAYAITDNSGGTGNKWNLVGNPFPSFIPANSGADATNNFLTVNTADLDPARVAIYIWNPAGAGSYDIINHASAATYIAPGQAFFIESKDSGASVDFTKVMQSHQTGDLFLKQQNTTPQIDIMVTDNSVTRSAQIKYIDGKTTGLDLGWDAGVFGGINSSFSIFTHLVADSKGTDFALQVLPNTDHENMVIPVGIKADAGKELTFSINAQQIPNGLKVFLEDKDTNTFTRLDLTNASYKTTLTTALNGIGRFYLHTKSQVLSTSNQELEHVSVYTTSKRNLRIVGLNNTSTSFAMFTILGKQVIKTSFQSSGVSDIQLPELATGVYIVHLQTPLGKLSKKIIIK